jgi:tRNA (guanine37-N1)-methyltransferase
MGVKVNEKNAERVKRYLMHKNIFDTHLRVFRKGGFIYFPIGKASADASMTIKEMGGTMLNAKFGSQGTQGLGKMPNKDIAKSYDILGNIAVLGCKPEYAKKLASIVLKSNKRVKTVLLKGGAVSGRYRTRKYVFVSGTRNFIADYRENGCSFRFDVRKVFFSPRLSFERNRIACASRNGENVMVMFAGVGPFAIEIANKNKESKVVAIELNKTAYKYLLENIALNKTGNVSAELGDVKKLAVKYEGFADRIVMPLPKTSSHFLDSALAVARKKCIIHYYTFCGYDEKEHRVSEIKKSVEAEKRKFRLLKLRVVRPYSRSTVEIVIDFAVY